MGGGNIFVKERNMQNRVRWTIVALILCGLGFSVILTRAQREQYGPPPLLLSSEQQERAEHWKSVLNEYFETTYRPLSTSVNQDLESLKNQLGGEYSLTKEQVERIRWLHEQLGATVAVVEARQDEGRTNYGPYPV